MTVPAWGANHIVRAVAVRTDGKFLVVGEKGYPACAWAALIGQTGKIEWQKCLVENKAPIKIGRLHAVRSIAGEGAVVRGTVISGKPGTSSFKQTLIAAMVSKSGDVGTITYGKEAAAKGTIEKEVVFQKIGDKTVSVALISQANSRVLVLHTRDKDDQVIATRLLLSSKRDDLFIDAVVPARNGEFVILAHGLMNGRPGDFFWRFNRAGKSVASRYWTPKESMAKRGRKAPRWAIEHKNGEIIAFGSISIVRLAADGTFIKTYDLTRGAYKYEISAVFRNADGTLMLHGRYWMQSGKSEYWLTNLGTWPD